MSKLPTQAWKKAKILLTHLGTASKQKTIIEDPDNIIQDFKTEVRFYFISNGNRTEWSPIRSVIIRVINKIGRPRSGSPICLITSMITD